MKELNESNTGMNEVNYMSVMAMTMAMANGALLISFFFLGAGGGSGCFARQKNGDFGRLTNLCFDLEMMNGLA